MKRVLFMNFSWRRIVRSAAAGLIRATFSDTVSIFCRLNLQFALQITQRISYDRAFQVVQKMQLFVVVVHRPRHHMHTALLPRDRVIAKIFHCIQSKNKQTGIEINRAEVLWLGLFGLHQFQNQNLFTLFINLLSLAASWEWLAKALAKHSYVIEGQRAI